MSRVTWGDKQREAQEAYDRYVKQLHDRAALLDELIAELGFYAQRDGLITYLVPATPLPDQKARRGVGELVVKYVDKRNETYRAH